MSALLMRTQYPTTWGAIEKVLRKHYSNQARHPVQYDRAVVLFIRHLNQHVDLDYMEEQLAAGKELALLSYVM